MDLSQRLIAGGPVVVCVLGLAHDLRQDIKAAYPACRVEVARPEWMDESNSVGD